MSTTKLTVNGIEVPLEWVSTMFQGDAFPGGFTYLLSIDASDAIASILEPSVELEPPPLDLAAKVLQRVTPLLRSGSIVPPRYLLNTIAKLSVSDCMRVTLEGACSPVIPSQSDAV